MRVLALITLAACLGATEAGSDPAAEAAAPDARTVAIAGLTLTIPADLTRDPEPTLGVLASWRSADGGAAISVVAREPGDGDQVEGQVADLMALGQDVALEAHGALDAPAGWHRVRYQLTLGDGRYAQDARIALVDGKQVVVLASWPVSEAARWDAALTAVLDGLSAVRNE